jgi:hypothetical protein
LHANELSRAFTMFNSFERGMGPSRIFFSQKETCENRNLADYFPCSGGNSRPLRFFEVWRAALFFPGSDFLVR